MTDPTLKAFEGKRVFVTGHTGFKGSWLSEWLIKRGATVYGYSLPPPTRPSLFAQLGLSQRLHDQRGDVRDRDSLGKAFRRARPDYAFHLAAQPLVSSAYKAPADTWSVNVLGTINFLEAVRRHGPDCAAVVVTTDKVYGDSARAQVEDDPLDACDPYGASKAAADLAVRSWRSSFELRHVAAARSGNVIGGGDWAPDRLVPDCIRAARAGKSLVVRRPRAVRPWQHVLDPLHGYLMLAARLRTGRVPGHAFNFGPGPAAHRPVCDVLEAVCHAMPLTWRIRPSGLPETEVLRLNAGLAQRTLGWRPIWNFRASVEKTIVWYREARSPALARQWTARHIEEFEASLR
jgi:CDP-glucose 4,6-dehydratase